jgi:exodeoxyribonuclease VII large subunit
MKVIVKGRITLYESRGAYQIDVFEMLQSGAGELQLAFEKLKQKLFQEGLFDESIKKEIPEYPERVGIVTSETGAALQDFIRVTQKRYPIVNLYLFNANVQGAGSADSIVNAIRTANKIEFDLDILVLARGGGSIEDLWSFNEERVARAIFSSDVPVVSAIGHEIDFTISDFAAEMIFPDVKELDQRIAEYSLDLKSIVSGKLGRLDKILRNFSTNYYLRRISDRLSEFRFRLDEADKNMGNKLSARFKNLRNVLESSEKLLNSYGPEQVLKRGFTIITRDDKIISRKSKLNPKDNIEIKFYDGDSKAVVTV